MKRASGYLSGINDTALYHIAEALVVSIKAVANLTRLADFGDDNRAVKACVISNLLHRSYKSLKNYLSACLFVALEGFDESFNA